MFEAMMGALKEQAAKTEIACFGSIEIALQFANTEPELL